MHTHRPPKINEKRRLRTHIFSEQGLLRTKSGHACIVFDSQKWRVYLFVHAPSRRMVLLSRKLINSQLLNCWLHNAHRLGLKFGVGQCVPKKWLIYARTRFRNHSARKSLQPFLLEVVPRVEEKKNRKSHIFHPSAGQPRTAVQGRQWSRGVLCPMESPVAICIQIGCLLSEIRPPAKIHVPVLQRRSTVTGTPLLNAAMRIPAKGSQTAE